MSLAEIYTRDEKVLSFEFFPPKKEEDLPRTFSLIERLGEYRPHFMTVTYGAGGGTRSLTRKMVDHIRNQLHVPAVAHLTCVNHSVAEIDEILTKLSDKGVKNILALRGDAPKGASKFEAHPDGFSCARDLAAHITKRGGFHVAVAGYPEPHQDAKSPEDDIRYLKEKVDAGAELVITQLFLKPEMYFEFLEKTTKAGINVPIVPGVMPIRSQKQLERFTSLCGATIPDDLRAALSKVSEDDVREFGIDWAVEISQVLLKGGAPGIHLYTLNTSLQSGPVVERLGLGQQ